MTSIWAFEQIEGFDLEPLEVTHRQPSLGLRSPAKGKAAAPQGVQASGPPKKAVAPEPWLYFG